jgi:hypothetical protein
MGQEWLFSKVRRGSRVLGQFFAELDRFSVAAGRVVAAFIARQWFLVSVLVLCGSVLALWKVPQWQRNLAITDPAKVDEAEDHHRATLAQILGGAFLLAGLYFTWQTLQVAREGQITERFTRAIDQLGAVDEKGKPKLGIRLGGVYALEQIARDSEKNYWPIMEILTAYVRENSPIPMDRYGKPDYASAKPVAAGIQAILTVLGRRVRTYRLEENQRLNLVGTNLRDANLAGAKLQNADLTRASLQGAELTMADLQQASLTEANLQGANFLHAGLRVGMGKANLQDANLHTANLEGAYLYEANLKGANLSYARNLTQGQVDSAIGDEKTQLTSPIQMPQSWKKPTVT